MMQGKSIRILPLTADRWDDLEALFGARGASAGCWCMFWRLEGADFKQSRGEGARLRLKRLTLENDIPGLLAYVNGRAAGWCSIGPRERYLGLEDSRRFRRFDDTPVWSIVCFFVDKGVRGQGLMRELLSGALLFAKKRGAHCVEGYPVDVRTPKLAGHKLQGDQGYMGIVSAFRDVGFIEVGRASETQLIMRYDIT